VILHSQQGGDACEPEIPCDLGLIVLEENARQKRYTPRFHPWETLGFNVTDAAEVTVAKKPGLAKEGRLTHVHKLSSLGVIKDCRKKFDQFAGIVLRFLACVPAEREDNFFLLLRQEAIGQVRPARNLLVLVVYFVKEHSYLKSVGDDLNRVGKYIGGGCGFGFGCGIGFRATKPLEKGEGELSRGPDT